MASRDDSRIRRVYELYASADSWSYTENMKFSLRVKKNYYLKYCISVLMQAINSVNPSRTLLDPSCSFLSL